MVAAPPPHMAEMKVAELIKADRGVWDEDLIREVVSERDATIILCMLVVEASLDDCWYWRDDARGIYSVRSVYRSLKAAGSTQSSIPMFTDWNKLWSLDIPPRTRHLLWRCMHNILATRAALTSRRVEVKLSCPLCDQETETSTHIMLHCVHLDALWGRFQGNLPRREGLELQDWLQMVFTLEKDLVQRVAFFMAGIWYARNNVVWNGSAWVTEVVFNLVMVQINHWSEGRHMSVTRGRL